MKKYTPPIPAGLMPLEAHREMKLEDILKEFLCVNDFSDDTIRGYKRDIQKFLNFLDLDRKTCEDLSSLSPKHIFLKAHEFLEGFKKHRPKTGKLLNPATINCVKHSLSSFFKYMVLHYGYEKNPLVYIKKLKTQNKSNTQHLTESEVIKMLLHMKEEAPKSETKTRNFLIVLGLMLEGLRRNEIANLRWDEIDFQNELFRITQKGAKEKISPIPREYLLMLKEFQIKHGRKCPYVFHPVQNNRFNDLEKPISTSYIYNVVRTVASKVVPNKKITPHSFRVTMATLGNKWGVNEKWILNGGGWSSRDMIDYYTQDNELKNNVILVMGKWLHSQGVI